jgi:DNA-binding transcriptional MocR family regulator
LFEQVLPLGIRFVPGALFSNSNQFDRFIRISCGGAFDRGTDDAVRVLGRMALDQG